MVGGVVKLVVVVRKGEKEGFKVLFEREKGLNLITFLITLALSDTKKPRYQYDNEAFQ